MDTISKEHRSWNMSRIRSKNTVPEKVVRSVLHGLGFRFRLHRKELPGRPDIILPKYGIAVFVNGCFWHRHKGCRYSYTPKTRTDFWQRKFSANVKRDQLVQQKLRELGWQPVVIWECQTEKLERLRALLSDLLKKKVKS